LGLALIERGGGGGLAVEETVPLILAQKLPEVGVCVTWITFDKTFEIAPKICD
jgi:energy-converting hydrogenase Eha subunit E